MPTRSSTSEKSTKLRMKKATLTSNDDVGREPTPTPSPSTSEKNSFKMAATPEQREQMVRETAYYLAEKNGFPEGKDDEYWRQAEDQIDQMLKD